MLKKKKPTSPQLKEKENQNDLKIDLEILKSDLSREIKKRKNSISIQ
jgi:hypothetical protein